LQKERDNQKKSAEIRRGTRRKPTLYISDIGPLVKAALQGLQHKKIQNL